MTGSHWKRSGLSLSSSIPQSLHLLRTSALSSLHPPSIYMTLLYGLRYTVVSKIFSWSKCVLRPVHRSTTEHSGLVWVTFTPSPSPSLAAAVFVTLWLCHWRVLSSRAPTNSSTVIHLLPLPHHSKADGVRFRWTQEAPQGPEGYESCWGLDNVLLVNAAHRPPLLEDNLDPPNTANWLFFPGATVKVHHLISRHYRSTKTQVSFL